MHGFGVRKGVQGKGCERERVTAMLGAGTAWGQGLLAEGTLECSAQQLSLHFAPKEAPFKRMTSCMESLQVLSASKKSKFSLKHLLSQEVSLPVANLSLKLK